MMLKNIPKTKILATVGPSCCTVTKLSEMIRAGADGFRINFSHGTVSDKALLYKNIRKAEKRSGKRVLIVQDLCGPKIRLGTMSGPVLLNRGQEITFVNSRKSASDEVPLPFPAVFRCIKRGERFFINDGTVELKVLKTGASRFISSVVKGGVISSNKGLNFPGQSFDFPALTAKDRKDLEFNRDFPVDFIALSFVRRAEDLQVLKRSMRRLKLDIPVIAKIEKTEALKNIKSILEGCDAIMIARGDLAVEAGFERIGILQKKLVSSAVKSGRPVIVATQMLDSMTHSSVPTRAEITDITNAVIEGADMLMLSAETAVGENPVQVVRTMNKVIRNAEKVETLLPALPAKEHIYGAVARIAVEAAEMLDIKAIVTPTMSGATTRKVAALRPDAHIIAITPDENLARRLNIHRGVVGEKIEVYNSTDQMIRVAEKLMIKKHFLKKGASYVLTGGSPPGGAGKTNLVRIEQL